MVPAELAAIQAVPFPGVLYELKLQTAKTDNRTHLYSSLSCLPLSLPGFVVTSPSVLTKRGVTAYFKGTNSIIFSLKR